MGKDLCRLPMKNSQVLLETQLCFPKGILFLVINSVTSEDNWEPIEASEETSPRLAAVKVVSMIDLKVN